MTKSALIAELAEGAGLTKAQTDAVFEGLEKVVAREVGAGRPITIAGLFKVVVVRKKATPAREGINPFTKEPMTIKAKPARNVVRVRPLKGLKDMI